MFVFGVDILRFLQCTSRHRWLSTSIVLRKANQIFTQYLPHIWRTHTQRNVVLPWNPPFKVPLLGQRHLRISVLSCLQWDCAQLMTFAIVHQQKHLQLILKQNTHSSSFLIHWKLLLRLIYCISLTSHYITITKLNSLNHLVIYLTFYQRIFLSIRTQTSALFHGTQNRRTDHADRWNTTDQHCCYRHCWVISIFLYLSEQKNHNRNTLPCFLLQSRSRKEAHYLFSAQYQIVRDDVLTWRNYFPIYA